MTLKLRVNLTSLVVCRTRASRGNRKTRMSFFIKTMLRELCRKSRPWRTRFGPNGAVVCGTNISCGVMTQNVREHDFLAVEGSSRSFDVLKREATVVSTITSQFQIQVFIKRVHDFVNLLLFHQHSPNAFVAQLRLIKNEVMRGGIPVNICTHFHDARESRRDRFRLMSPVNNDKHTRR